MNESNQIVFKRLSHEEVEAVLEVATDKEVTIGRTS